MTSTGIDLIAAERQRQIEELGFTSGHDREHAADAALPNAAMAYLLAATPPDWYEPGFWNHLVPRSWPWGAEAWQARDHTDPIRELVKAGALIAAEIDRRLAEAEDRPHA